MKLAGVSRRAFIKQATAGEVLLVGLQTALADDPDSALLGEKQGTKAKATSQKPSGSTTKRESHCKFSELPMSCIKPEGWLRKYLEIQRDGLTGNLDTRGGFPFDTCGWAGPEISRVPRDVDPYEQTAYWVDGMIRCGYLLRDAHLTDKARKHTDYVLSHPDRDGYLGPKYLKNRSRWPHVIFFRALFAQSSATGDQGIVAALKKHFLSSPYAYEKGREAPSIEAMLWTYERDGDPALLSLAEDVYKKSNDSSEARVNKVSAEIFKEDGPCQAHGVTYNEMAKLGAILYIHTGKEDYLIPSVAAYKKLERYHMLVDGVNSSSEILREVTPLESHETCDIADFTWSVGYLLMATGKADYADKIERACFNAAPGAVSRDFTALQYFSCPNQVVAAHNTNHNVYFRGNRAMAFGPEPFAQCCSGNVNRIMPNFASRVWLGDGHGGLVAALYAPSTVSHRVGKNQTEVTVTENTRYPFSDRIEFVMKTDGDVEFPFTLRIPGWCREPQILLNGSPVEERPETGTFVTLIRKFRNGDTITLLLPQEIKVSKWPPGGVALERGPLVYSLKIVEDWQSGRLAAVNLLGIYNVSDVYPGLVANNVYPLSKWNYALALDLENPTKQVQVIESTWKGEFPWSPETAPIMLRVPAREITGWELDKKQEVEFEAWIPDPDFVPIPDQRSSGPRHFSRKGDYLFTPRLPDPSTLAAQLKDETEMITLIPYGSAKLRMTIFPYAKSPNGV